jgi:Ca-activated chloride channel family protein
MTLSGLVRNRPEQFRFQADLDGDIRNAFIPRLWATRRVGFLQEQIRVNGKNTELIREIKRLGRTYGILTEYTSFLIVEDSIAPHRREQVRRDFNRAAEKILSRESGAGAVDAATRGGAMKKGIMLGAAAVMGANALRPAFENAGFHGKDLRHVVRTVYDKTFYRRPEHGYWYDSLIAAGENPRPDVTVTIRSAAFFKLLRQYPALRRYALVGDKFVVRIDNRIIRITPED